MSFKLANINGRAALTLGDNYYDLEKVSGGDLSSDPMMALESLDVLSALSARLEEAIPDGRLADVELGPPVPRPANCYAVGLNYRNHALESNLPIPDVPMVFSKYSSCITGPSANIEMRSDYIDYEAELVVVIGRGGKDIAAENGWSHVAGLCVGQDISDRAVQLTTTPPQFNLGKSFDTFGPIGPVLTSLDALDDPSSLALVCQVNGEVRQQDNTNDLIFDVPAIIAYLSNILTLRTGDLIFTGTPAGVAATTENYLRDGDMLTTTIEGLGSLHNRCVRSSDHARAAVVPELYTSMVGALKAKQ